MTPARNRPILIAGPTASGKSALAVALAAHCGGVVVNADAMQVYRELRIITARPTPAEEARVPHRLYGHVSAAEPYSVARWLADIAHALVEATADGRRPIVVGGTGLYFKALLEGLSPVPPVPAELRAHWRRAAVAAAPGVLHGMLAARDPLMAARLMPADTQRLTRALEVFDATGRSLAEWQAMKGPSVLAADNAVRIVVRPPRAELVERCDRRFMQMVEQGALAEVASLLALALPQSSPAMRALGVPPLAAHLVSGLPLDAAVEQAQRQTRQYVKRQETWLNRNMSTWNIVQTAVNCENASQFVHLID